MSTKPLFKIFSILLLVSVALTSCSTAATTIAPATATTVAATDTSVPVANTVAPTNTSAPSATVAPTAISGTVTVWCWKAGWADAVVASGALDAFKAAYPNITVNYVELSSADVYQKLPLAIQAGTGAPDVACVESSHLAQMVSLGGLADLTDKVAPYVNKLNAYKWKDATSNGKYYAMPWDSGPVVTYYRRDVFKAAGLADDPDSVSAMISTWDGYLQTCKTIKEKTGSDCFSSNKANNYGRLYEMMLWQQGLGYYDANGNVTVDSADNVATLTELAKFWDAGVVSNQLEWTDGWYAEMARKTVAEKPVATLVEAAWMGVFLKSWIAAGTDGLWGVALMPAMKDGQVRSANDGGSNLVIPQQSQNQEAAWALVQFLLGRSDSQVSIFKKADIFPSLTDAYTDPVFSEADPFFDNQNVRQVYVSVAKQIPSANIYGPYYTAMNGFVATAIQQVATGAKTPADALKEAADSIRQQTGLK